MRTILLVDDDEDDRILFLEAIDHLDQSIQCWAAKDGQHALDILSYDKLILPDIIFLDLNMPRMNGLEFLKIVKNDHRLKSVPIIIYTTSSNSEDIRKTKAMGAVDFITKPSDFDQLYQKLISLLNKHSVLSYLDKQ